MLFRKTKTRIHNLEVQVENLQKKVKQLECSHRYTRFERCSGYYYSTEAIYREVCIDCEKYIRSLGEKKKIEIEMDRLKKRQEQLTEE